MPQTNGKIEDAKVELPDGKMHYQALGEGSPLLLLHPMGTSVYAWSRVMRQLAAGHTVYALDAMGQGDSDKPGKDYTIEEFANAVVNFMKAKSIAKASLVGNSIGAVFAAQVAAVHPDMVDKLVLVGCPCRETEKERQESLASMKTRYDDKGLPFPRTMETLKQSYTRVSAELLAKVNDDLRKVGVWAYKTSLAFNNYDIVTAFKQVKAPTLVIFGERDMLRDKENAIKNYVKGSQLVLIPDAGHLPQMDNPDEFLKVVAPFVA
jgi:pimeloyl-ACP methyl ester carboxylesterase